MSWGKGLIIVLGLMQFSHVAQARDIETFTDSQGILHITNTGPKQQGSPTNPPSPGATLRPGILPRKAPASFPAGRPAPEAQAPAPEPEAQDPAPQSEAVPGAPVPVDPQPGSRVIHPEDSGGVMLAGRTGNKAEPGAAAETPTSQLRQVSWSPPQPVEPPSEGNIVVGRDRRGVIHINNVGLDEAPLIAPAPPAPAVQKQARSPAKILPAVHEVSCSELGPEVAAYLEDKLLSHSPVWVGRTVQRCRDPQGVWQIVNAPPPAMQPSEEPVTAAPEALAALAFQKQARSRAAILPAVYEESCSELGPEVAAYLEDKLLGHSPDWVGRTVQRYRDPQGVWQIVNAPPPAMQPSEEPVTASPEALAGLAAAPVPPLTPTSPAMAWGPGLVKLSSGSAPTVVARRDRRGVVHIFTRDSAELVSDRNNPVNFLGRVPPALQSCIIEAAELYQLPIPLILALIRQESNFTHQAVSPKGAMGLMQLMPGTAADLGVRDPFDPRENILAGCRYFRQLLDSFQGNVPLALAAYNAGHHRVVSAGCQVPAIKETQEFVTQVMGLYHLLERHASRL
jgi:hypothetical protein